ncbi:MAG: hypothetical protein GC204_01170 [Chloroflexi bacterium]|nr:hypothetical protein [Chloroflexota bacterium]
MQNLQGQSWHTAQWGTWGWGETILKLIAIAAGIVAFFQSAGDFVIGGNPHLAAVIVIALAALASVGQVGIRFMQKEIISLIFAVLNLLGHFGLLIALLRVPTDLTLALVFGVFYVLGQLTKLQFLRVTGYTEGGANTSAMLRVTGVITVIYIVFTVLLLL